MANTSSYNEHQILEILKKRALLSNISAKVLLGFIDKWKVDAYKAVVETHCIEESRLADVLSEEFHIGRLARLRSRQVDKNALKFLSYRDAMTMCMMPFSFDAEENLVVAIADPTPRSCIQEWTASCPKKVVFEVAERSEIEASIQRHYPLSMQLPITMSTYMNDVTG